MVNSKKNLKQKENTKDKKHFNKKKWRESHFSTKKKIEQFDEVRRKNLLRKYQKELKISGVNVTSNSQVPESSKKETPLSALKQAQLKYEKIQEEKRRRKEEIERQKEERKAALEAYKKKKALKFKKLSQKTRKGQPVMKGRMELLLEKIQNNYGSVGT